MGYELGIGINPLKKYSNDFNFYSQTDMKKIRTSTEKHTDEMSLHIDIPPFVKVAGIWLSVSLLAGCAGYCTIKILKKYRDWKRERDGFNSYGSIKKIRYDEKIKRNLEFGVGNNSGVKDHGAFPDKKRKKITFSKKVKREMREKSR